MREVLLSESHGTHKAFPIRSICCSIACTTALGINLVSSVVVVLALAVIVQFGRTVGTRRGESDLGLGLGFVVGAGFFVFGGQILLAVGVPPDFAHWCVLLVMTATIVSTYRRRTKSIRTSTKNTFNEFLAALSIAMLITSARQGWLFAFAIPLMVLERLSWSRCKRSTKALVLLVLLPAGWVLSQKLRPDFWWYFYQGNDSQFFESISWSTTEWGVLEHPGLVGGSTFAYHWFGYAFLGALSHVASLEPWDALMKIGVPMTLVFFINLLFSEISRNLRRLNFWVLIFGLVIASITFSSRFDSYGFSILIALGFIQLIEKKSHQAFSLMTGLVIGICALELVLSKVSTSLVVLSYLVLIAGVNRLRRERVLWLPLTLLLAAVGACYLFLFRNLPSTGVLSFSPSIRGSLIEIRNLLETPVLPVSIFIWLVALVVFRKQPKSTNVPLVVLFILVPAGLAFHLLQANTFSAYLGIPAIHILNFLLTRRILKTVNSWQLNNFRRFVIASGLFVFIGVLVGYHYVFYINQFISRVQISWIQGEFGSSVLVGSGYVFVLTVLFAVAYFFCLTARQRVVLMASLTLVSVSIGSNLSSYKQQMSRGPAFYTNWLGNSAPFATPDLVALGRFIRSSTKSDAVLATNNYCCSGQSWWHEIRNDLTLHNLSSYGETKWGGANYLLPAETRRRFLVSGLRFQTGEALPTSEQVRRMDLSLSFANNPTKEVASELKSYGVSGYIVNLALTNKRDWSEFAVEEFRSGEFAYLELKN